MKKINLLKTALINSLGTVAYISLVATFMTFAEKIFGGDGKDTVMAPIYFLLLFVTSASITGYLVVGKSLLLYLSGQREEAVKLFGYTLACLFCFTTIALLINILIR
jgi:heme O synthase-like polyprenyltransferase